MKKILLVIHPNHLNEIFSSMRVAQKVMFITLFTCSWFSPLYAQQWITRGNGQEVASATSNYTAITTTIEGEEGTLTVPYVVFTEANIAKVKKYNAGAWEQVGNNVSAGTATYTRIYADRNNRLFVSYVDVANGNRLAIKTYNPSLALWEPLNGDANNLYVSAGAVTNIVGQYNATPRSSFALDTANTPYIFFGEGTSLNPTVKRYNGTSWENVGVGPVSSDRAIGVSIAIDSTVNIPYIVYLQQATSTSTTGTIVVYRYTNSWELMAVPNPVLPGSATTGATNAARHTALAFNSTWDPIISYFNAGNSNRATIITYNKTAANWSYGGTISTRDISNNNLLRDDGGNLYNSFTDAISNGSGRSVARVMKQRAGTTTWIELKDPTVIDGIDEPAGSLQITIGKQDTSLPFIIYTKANSSSVTTPVVRRFSIVAIPPPPPPAPDPVVTAPKQMEMLTRSLVAVRISATQVYVGWRMLGTDPTDVAFNLYRDGILLNSAPLASSTNYIDNTGADGQYAVKVIANGIEQFGADRSGAVWAQNYLNISLDRPAAGVTPAGEAYTYSPNDASIGDVDGDGEYEIILKWDPSNAKDNSQAGYTGNVYLDAYKLNGVKLWRIDLSRNVRAGAHYTQLMVYDLDGDGKAEVACKTGDGTVDGAGIAIGNAGADYRNSGGYILTGPEYLTVFNGLTGAAMATSNYLPARGSVSSWGDNYGNRVDRFIAAVAYLDGARPSLIMGRGYYTRLVRAAWDYRNGQLTSRWVFDSNTPGNAAWAGQGNHQMTVGDFDGDGKDEFSNGSSAINDNGQGLWANGMGHGDALHLTDIDPGRPGLEMWQPYEDPANNGMIGAALVDAKTGGRIFTVPLATPADVGRALSANVDPRYKGNEVWAARGNLYTANGLQIGTEKPSMNFTIWWDADSTRELLDGTNITKWNHITNSNPAIFTAFNCASNNSTKSTPALTADIFGDWREEVIFRTTDNLNLRIFSTTAVAQNRFSTFMHDPQYRTAVAWQNSAYNQPPHPGFYVGEDMPAAPVPNIYIAAVQALPVKLLTFSAVEKRDVVDLQWTTANETGNNNFTIERSKDGKVFAPFYTTNGSGTSTREHTYFATDRNPFDEINYYRLKQTDVDGRYSYSTIRMVKMIGKKDKLSITPNPVTNTARLNYNSTSATLKVLVSTLEGKVMMKLDGSIYRVNEQLKNKLATLKAGLYLIQLIDMDEKYTVQFVKK